MREPSCRWRFHLGRVIVAFGIFAYFASLAAASEIVDTITRIKPSIVAVGTFERGRSPAFQFRGTGFAVGNGTTIVTNAHVLPSLTDVAHRESLAILAPGSTSDGSQIREGRATAIDTGHDIALITIEGAALPALKLRDSNAVREGQEILITGFPIGAVLGPFPATHRGMVSSITPIAIPQGNANDLDAVVIRRLSSGTFPVFQLDATAYPGSSGSPVYDPVTGEVMGIVNMVFVKGTKETALSQPSGITYAVPARYLDDLLRSLSRDTPRK